MAYSEYWSNQPERNQNITAEGEGFRGMWRIERVVAEQVPVGKRN